jgi:TonB family protein
LIVLCGFTEAVNYNRKEFNLKVDVYCIGVRVYSFNIEFGELNRGALLNENYTYFLQNGNIIIDSLIDKKMYKRYNYDEHGNIIQEMRILVGAGRKGKIGNTEFNFNDTTDCYRYRNEYSADGHLKEVSKYSKNGQILKVKYTRSTTSENAVYWGKRNIEKVIITTKANRTTELYSEINDYKSPTFTIVETLNNKGLVVKKSSQFFGELISSETLYSYDEHDNVITETSKVSTASRGERKAFTYRYDYDKKGNWIRKIGFNNGKVISWTERIIFYASSPSDYTKIVEQDKQVTERHIKIGNKERQYKDSIAARKKVHEDSIAAKKKAYEDSLITVVCKLDKIIEKELLQKHIVAVPQSLYNNYNFDIKLRDIDGEIKNMTINGNIIQFTLKKGKKTIDVDLLESQNRNYYWSWNDNSEGHDEFQIGYSSDYNDIVIARPFMLLLHKEEGIYKAYSPDPQIINNYVINNILNAKEKKDPVFLREHTQLFWHANKGSVVDHYKELIAGNEKTTLENSNKPTIAQHSDNSEIYDVADEIPYFPGGPSALLNYLSNAVRYPVDAEARGAQGRVLCSFVIEIDGSTSNIKVTKGVDPSLDKEAIRVISHMPKWIPGKRNGTPVRVRYSAPVSFRLQ